MRIQQLEKAFCKLFDLITDKTRPENCYVHEWYVHNEWKELKAIRENIEYDPDMEEEV